MSIGSTISATGGAHAGGGSPLHNESIMASAGSGKTYALSSRYLRLILMGAEPGSILASTFTRLAAGEIRDRILAHLAEAAIDDVQRDELARSLASASRPGEARPLTKSEVLSALEHLTRNLHRLHIRTLDSFFAQVVRCFALELGIDPAAEIADAELDRDMRREAIETLLDERDPQPLIDLLRVLTEGSAARSVTDVIDGEMAALYELYREAPPSAWDLIDFWKPLDDDELHSAIETLCVTPSQENGHHVNAHRADCERARAAGAASFDDWCSFLSKGLPCSIIQKEAIFQRKAVPPNVIAAYEPLIDHARAVIRNALVARTRSTRDLLDRFHHRYEEAKVRHKAMTFADITAKMAEVFSTLGSRSSAQHEQPTAEEICFRLDATLRHLLLDEMQDTSVQQWRALSEIVRNIISEPPPIRSFYCVGDVKQSIYGWREACPEILAQMPALIESLGGDPEHMCESEPLIRNWRSSPAVLQTVDRVLIDTSSNPAMEGCPQAAESWDSAYLPHHAQFQDRAGYVELRIAPRASDGDDDQNALRIEYAADLIARLCRDAPGRSVGVLTRTNKCVNRFLYELGPARRQLDVAGRGGGSLTDSAAVNVILDLLRLADHPDHTIAGFNVVHSPLGEALSFTNLKQQRHRIARTIRMQLLNEGYARTIGRWIRMIGARTDKRQFRRLIQLQQLAARFDAHASLRADDFVALAESTDVGNDPAGAQVQVMTVHQSKGLEFDIVVLADLDQDIVRMSGLKMITQRDAVGNITRVARYMNKEIWSHFDDLESMYHQQKMRMARESLCLLYVAMTRARNALHMIIDPPAENAKKVRGRLSSIIRCALADEDVEPDTVVYRCGDERWFERQPVAAESEVKADPLPTNISIAPESGEVPRGRATASASQLLHDEHPDGRRAAPTFLRLGDRAARERGTAIHAMFEQIEWIEEFQPNRNQLKRIALKSAPRRGEAWADQQVDAFLNMIEGDAIRSVLSREAAGDGAVVMREVPFARLVDGAAQRGMIDRLTARYGAEGACTCAVVLDFKTDAVGAAAAITRAAQYQSQLETYRAAAARLLDIEMDRVSMKLLFVSCGEIVDLLSR